MTEQETPLWRRQIEVGLYESEEAEEATYKLMFRQPTVEEVISAQELSEQRAKMPGGQFAAACLKLAQPLCVSEPDGFFDSGAALFAAVDIFEAVFFRTGFALATGAPGSRRLGARREGQLWISDRRGKEKGGDGQEVSGLPDDVRRAELPAEVAGADVQGVPQAGGPSTGDAIDSGLEAGA